MKGSVRKRIENKKTKNNDSDLSYISKKNESNGRKNKKKEEN